MINNLIFDEDLNYNRSEFFNFRIFYKVKNISKISRIN
jgi:hypothetical protein